MIAFDQLRTHQKEAVLAIKAAFRSGHKRIILCGPCGFGKSIVAAFMAQESAGNGKAVAVLVDRRELVKQLSGTLSEYLIDHGVLMAASERYRPEELIQVCSAQTLEARGSFPSMKLVLADEAHSIREQFKTLMANNPDLYCIGMTATPLTKGMGEIYTHVVNVCTTNWLVEQGWLIAPIVYAAKAIDMKGAKVIAGEWSDKEVESRGLQIVGDIVNEWVDKTRLHFGGPAKTIVFSATVNHGAEICRQFNELGYRFEQISYKDSDEERRSELIKEYRRPDSSIVGLVACEVFSRGFDVPDVLVGIDARPLRKSLSGHIQKIGRVMRPATGKTKALWLCHANNYLRFQTDTDRIFAEGIHELDDGKLDDTVRPEPDEKTFEKSKCAACGFVLPAYAENCPACGHARQRRVMVEIVAGEMVLINGKQHEATGKYAYLADKDAIWSQLCWMAHRRKGDIEDAQRWARAKYRSIYNKAPPTEFAQTLMHPCDELTGKIKHDNIRWAKGRGKAEMRV